MLGDGLCTAHLLRVLLLLFTRFLGPGLIPIENFTIRDQETVHIYTDEEHVLAYATSHTSTKIDSLNACSSAQFARVVARPF